MENTDGLLSSLISRSRPTTKYKVYKKRWFILFIYSINSMANAVLFACLSAINDIAASYWKVQPNVIDWLPNSFILIYVFIALPSAYFITKLGLRSSMIIVSSLNALSTALHFAGSLRDGFIFVLVGQTAAALSVGFLLQIAARLSTVWFPECEHAKATSIGLFMNISGIAIGFLQPSQMVPVSDMDAIKAGIFNMFLSQLIFLVFCLLLVYLFFDEQPRTPPSYAAAFTKGPELQMGFKASLKELACNLHFNFLAHMYGLYYGMYVFFFIVLNQIVSNKVSQSLVGWMGFSAAVFAILGVMINGLLIDKYQCYKLLSMSTMFFSLVSWIAFTFVLLHTDSPIGIFIAFSFVGFFGIPYFALGIEQAAEMTFPVPEATSSAVILIIGSLYGFIFVLFFGTWIEKGKLAIVCYTTTGVYAVTFIISCCINIVLKKHIAEMKHARVNYGVGNIPIKKYNTDESV